MITIELLYFFFLIIFAIYIPGNFLLKIFKFGNKDLLITSVLSLSLGICLFMISTYLLSWLKLDFLYNFLLIATFILFLKYLKNIKKIRIGKIPLFELSIIFLGSFAMTYIMWRSGSIENGNLVFYGVNSADAIYHLSLIGNLKFNFPPTHPGLYELPLRGYNFFYDLMVAYFSKYYKLEIIDLFFRFFPLFLSFFYGISGWALGTFLKMKRPTLLIFIFLLYFAQGFSRVISFGKITSYDSGIVQPIANIVDPSVILSVCLLFSLFILIFSERKKLSFVLPVLILGILPMIKIYTAFLAFTAVGVLFLLEVIRKRDFYYLKLLLPAGLIAAISYFPINYGSGKLIFAPNLIYRHYLESISANNNLTWYLRLLVFEEHNNYPKIIFYKFILVLPLFYLPSLGLRLVNAIYVKTLFTKSFYSERNIFLMVIVISGFIIPSLFIQSIAVFVVIQFLWIVFFVLLIPTAYSLANLLGVVTRLKSVVFIVIIILLSLPENYMLFKLYSSSPTQIDLKLVEIAKKISEIPNNQGVMVLNTQKTELGYQSDYKIPIISALSSRSVYFEPEIMEFSGVQDIIDVRKKEIGDLNEVLISCSDPDAILVELKKKAIETKSPYILDLKKTQCFDKLKNIELIYKNSNYSLYKIL